MKEIHNKLTGRSRVPVYIRNEIRRIVRSNEIDYIRLFSERARMKFWCIFNLNKSRVDKAAKEVEEFCRKENIKVTRGYYPLSFRSGFSLVFYFDR